MTDPVGKRAEVQQLRDLPGQLEGNQKTNPLHRLYPTSENHHRGHGQDKQIQTEIAKHDPFGLAMDHPARSSFSGQGPTFEQFLKKTGTRAIALTPGLFSVLEKKDKWDHKAGQTQPGKNDVKKAKNEKSDCHTIEVIRPIVFSHIDPLHRMIGCKPQLSYRCCRFRQTKFLPHFQSCFNTIREKAKYDRDKVTF